MIFSQVQGFRIDVINDDDDDNDDNDDDDDNDFGDNNNGVVDLLENFSDRPILCKNSICQRALQHLDMSLSLKNLTRY